MMAPYVEEFAGFCLLLLIGFSTVGVLIGIASLIKIMWDTNWKGR